MKNMNIRLANAIVGLSVVIGVGLISSGIVFGVNAEPPGDGVTPTFTGLIVNGPTTATGAVTINGNPNINGNLDVTGQTTTNILAANRLIGNGVGEITISSLINSTTDITTEESIIADQFIRGGRSIIAAEGIVAGGNITSTAGKIGKYYRLRSAPINVAATSALPPVAVSCPVGIAVSCSVYPAANDASLGKYLGLGVAPLINGNGIHGCQPKVYNSSAAAISLYVYAVCFDAAGTALGAGNYSLNL